MEKRESWLLCFDVFLVFRDCCVALPHGAIGCPQFVIVVFPYHSHFLFLNISDIDLRLQYHISNPNTLVSYTNYNQSLCQI